MTNRNTRILHAWLCLFGAVLVVLASNTSYAARLQAATGAVAPASKQQGKLSTRLAALLQRGDQVQGAAATARLLGLPAEGPGSLLENAAGDVLVYIVGSTSKSSLDTIAATGAQIVHSSERHGVVTAYADIAVLRSLAAKASVRFVQEALEPELRSRQDTPDAVAKLQPAQVGCPTAITSEGDAQLGAAAARTQYAVDGSGVTVGVLSDSYNTESLTSVNAENDVATGDLPGTGNPCGRTTPLQVLEETTDPPSSIDEGRAMAQIVHDLAPGSKLAFATAFNGFFDFADNIRRLRSQAAADIIVDDVSYFEEPFYQEGPIELAITDVVGAGALYFTSAGNDNRVDPAGNPTGSYEAPAFRPVACPTTPPFSSFGFVDCHDFNPAAATDVGMGITLPAGASFRLILQWSEPWFGVSTDIDAYLLNAANTVVAQGATATGISPFELMFYQNTTGAPQTVSLVIGRYTLGDGIPRIKFIENDAPSSTTLEYNPTNSSDIFGPTVYGHSAGTNALSLAAVRFNQPTAAGNPIVPEVFSSLGPATLLFEPVERIDPAAPLAAPEVRSKPDVAATDGGRTTFFFLTTTAEGANCNPGQPTSVCRFLGTSAAAPHAAAVAALMKQRANARGARLDRLQTEQILESTATQMGGTPQQRGAGLINAVAAVGAVDTLPVPRYLPLAAK